MVYAVTIDVSAEVKAKPQTLEWQYYHVRCNSWQGPFPDEQKAFEEGAKMYYGGCGQDQRITNYGTWGSAGVCGPGSSFPKWPSDFQYGIEVRNLRGVTVEYCQNPSNGDWSSDGFVIKRERTADCPGNLANNNQECSALLVPEKDFAQSCEVNSISIELGNKTETVVDYAGSQNLILSRTYNSVKGEWLFNFETSVQQGGNGAVFVSRANGESLVFTESNGVYTGYADSSTILRRLDDNGILLGWELQEENANTLTYDAEGRLARVVYKSGDEQFLSYDEIGQLAVIESNRDGDISFTWSYGKVVNVEVPGNINYQYSYDTNDNLIARTESENNVELASVIYHYENTSFPNALTGITDENGVRFATWTYDVQGRANSSQRSGGVENVTIDYANLEHSTDPRVVVTSELGKQTTYHFQIIAGERKKVLVEGHQSSGCEAANKNYSYYPTGLLKTKTDWEGNTTFYHYNERGLESARIEGHGSTLARLILTEWHPQYNLRTKIIEPNRETIYTYDLQGRQLSMVVNHAAPFDPNLDYNTVDSDEDGLADLWEQNYFGSLQYSGTADFDNDGVTNWQEFELSLNPTDGNQDSDDDNLSDAWEIQFFEDLSHIGTEDFDGDGVSNYDELIAGTDPTQNSYVNFLDSDRMVNGLQLTDNNTTLSGANLANSQRLAYAKGALAPGKKYYWEVSPTSTDVIVGIGSDDLLVEQGNFAGKTPNSYGWWTNNGALYNNGQSGVTIGHGNNDRLMIAFDPDTGKLWFGLNGVWQGDPALGAGAHFSDLVGLFYPVVSISMHGQATMHFSSTEWLYSAPQGFVLTELHDVDEDGLHDNWEHEYFGNLIQAPEGDFDADGLSNQEEFELDLNPTDGNSDSDADNLSDVWEIQFFEDLSHVGTEDFDGDGVSNYDEFVAGTDPTENLQRNYLDVARMVNGLQLTDNNTTLSGANLANSQRLVYAKGALAPGKKYYWEVSPTSTDVIAGLGSDDLIVTQGNYPGKTANSYGWWTNNGALYNNGQSGVTIGHGNNDRLMIAFDPDTGKLWFGLNGVWQGDPSAGTGAHFSNLTGLFYPVVSISMYGQATVHFQTNELLYTPPQGFVLSEIE
ncbi:hypothetical protein NBRC116493_35820 [Aurantivibrio infirmus]